MGSRLPPEPGYGPPWFQSGGQGNLSELPNLRPVPDFPGAPRPVVRIGERRYPMTDEMRAAYEDMWGGKLAPPDARINSERDNMSDVTDMATIGYNPQANLYPSTSLPQGTREFLARLGLNMAQTALIVGGAITSFVLTPLFGGGLHAKLRDMMFMAGLASMGAGGIWMASNWLKVQSPIVAKSAFINPSLLQNTQIHTQKYANPVNNLGDVKPENRFDLQTNYVMNKPDDSFDSRINDMILKEARSLGFGTAGNYPVRMQPYQIKTLIPTTQVEPARDFNTVKMIS